MLKEFGVKFECRSEETVIIDEIEQEDATYDFADWGVNAEIIADLLESFKNDYPKKIYVAAESESIFEQKKGDIGIMQEYGYIAIAKAQEFEDFEENNGTVSPSHHWKIIMRNNKQFFMPEVENER
jgi:hypothetical protein